MSNTDIKSLGSFVWSIAERICSDAIISQNRKNMLTFSTLLDTSAAKHESK